MLSILITGANGLLGQSLVTVLLEQGHRVIATSRGESRLRPQDNAKRFTYVSADVTGQMEWDEIMQREQPDVVVHAAAITQIDECEVQQNVCFDVNVQGTANVLLSAEKYSRFFVYLSTDFVFDGEKGNYNEEDDVNPISWYGFTKVQAEGIVETSEIPFAIVRTCLVYGQPPTGARSNIISWVKDSLAGGRQIRVVDDQVRTPTYVKDLAIGIALVIEKQATGIFHISGKDVLTPYQMAIATAEHLNLDTYLIERVDASVFSQPAKRPLRTGFDISRARRELGYEPLDFREGLDRSL